MRKLPTSDSTGLELSLSLPSTESLRQHATLIHNHSELILTRTIGYWCHTVMWRSSHVFYRARNHYKTIQNSYTTTQNVYKRLLSDTHDILLCDGAPCKTGKLQNSDTREGGITGLELSRFLQSMKSLQNDTKLTYSYINYLLYISIHTYIYTYMYIYTCI